jgi:hypothetical protein
MWYVLAQIKSMVALVENVLLLCLHMTDPLYKIEVNCKLNCTTCCAYTWQIHYLTLKVNCELNCGI